MLEGGFKVEVVPGTIVGDLLGIVGVLAVTVVLGGRDGDQIPFRDPDFEPSKSCPYSRKDEVARHRRRAQTDRSMRIPDLRNAHPFDQPSTKPAKSGQLGPMRLNEGRA